MNILFDTNVWLDVALNRQPYFMHSYAALQEGIDSNDQIYIAATSLKDIFYICSRLADSDKAYSAINEILTIAEVSTVDNIVCHAALPLERPDYEDGIIAATAITNGHDCIISRDINAFTDIDILKLTPEEFILSRGHVEINY